MHIYIFILYLFSGEIREHMLTERGGRELKPIISPSPQVLWCNEDNFMFKLQNYDQVVLDNYS